MPASATKGVKRNQKKKIADEGGIQNWTAKEKEVLRHLLRERGSKMIGDTSTLKMHLPTRYVHLKENFVKMGRPFANFVSDGEQSSGNLAKAPIEQWIYSLRQYRGAYYCSHANLVSKALSHIALFEKQPEVKETGGIEYSQIYEYFATLMLGEVPKELSPANAKRVLNLLTEFTSFVKARVPEANQLLASISHPPPKTESFNETRLERSKQNVMTPEQVRDLEAEKERDLQKITSLIYGSVAFNPFKLPTPD